MVDPYVRNARQHATLAATTGLLFAKYEAWTGFGWVELVIPLGLLIVAVVAAKNLAGIIATAARNPRY